ncbi:Angiopoietin 4 [Branchiostoma belcheri]|nr:Angiopoietin 4 [Branchiostoma belcheri]
MSETGDSGAETTDIITNNVCKTKWSRWCKKFWWTFGWLVVAVMAVALPFVAVNLQILSREVMKNSERLTEFEPSCAILGGRGQSSSGPLESNWCSCPAPTAPPQVTLPAAVTAPPQVKTPAVPTAPPQVTTPAAPTAPPQVTTPAAPTAPPQVTTPAAPTAPPQVKTPAVPTAPPQVTTPAAPTAPPQVTTPAAPTAPPQVTTPAAPTAPPQVKTPAVPTGPPADADCAAYKAAGYTTSGVYTLGQPLSGVTVYCDMDMDIEGGWTVIQRRLDGSVPFDRTWQEYKRGFGNKNGEYWLGNENIHLLTTQKDYHLRIDMLSWDRRIRYAKYYTFRVAGESDGYRLTVSG